MPVTFKPILPDKFNSSAFTKAFEIAVKEQTIINDNEYKKTYRTFSHKPTFTQKYKTTATEISGITETSGDGSTENPYPFVERGTSVRYATMTSDFSPKTRTRIIGSSRGRGGKLFVSKKHPRPGIKAREFSQEIAKRQQPKFAKRVKVAMIKGAKESGHEYKS